MPLRLLIYCFTFLFATALQAQVANDSIAQALRLEVGMPHTSTTAHSTVEWACVDESLTGKCIQYHNDQWFWFNPGAHTSLYLNIWDQDCRKLKGVQAVVIDGEACRPETYTILACVSLETQEDIHLKLEGLQPHKDYLLNIDGYLQDFCQFTLSLDASPKGISIQEPLPIPIHSEQNSALIHFSWELPDSLQHKITHFEVARRRPADPTYSPARQLPVGYDSRGSRQQHFSHTDTLPDRSEMHYRLSAYDADGRHWLLQEYSFKNREAGQPSTSQSLVWLPLDYRDKTPLTIFIWDTYSGKLLRRNSLTFSRRQASSYGINTLPFKEKGVFSITVEVINDKTGEKSKHLFSL
jgi:hypothetical protein